MRQKAPHETLKKCSGKDDNSAIDKAIAHPKIIAVGGVKGGTGKSIFAANLGIFLSSRGMRTVLVDLDLGSANLHLHLGKISLEYHVNDFLNKRVTTINEIMVPTNYGPYLIGGDSSQLGAANIEFSRKLKLLRSFKEIDADYVVIDLGGDTAYNIIDFFIAADHKFIITTFYPAAFLGTYNFIKVALYRSLNRLFGPESTFNFRKDRSLKRLIHDATIGTHGDRVKNIDQLIRLVKEQQPWNLSLLMGVLKDFNPKLIVNMITEEARAIKMVETIQKLTRKMLSIEVGYLGSIPFQPEIDRSASEMVPFIVRYPNGILTEKMQRVIEEIGQNLRASP
jgi:flagellar biosynthesis protein FlhG